MRKLRKSAEKSVVDRVETAVEALNVSVNEFGYVNIPYMLSIYEADRDTLIKELDGIIFLNPDRYNENNPDAGWETADEYLSGNVRDKLRVAKQWRRRPIIRRQKDLPPMPQP